MENHDNTINTINDIDDFRSIQTMVDKKKSSVVLFVFPRDIFFCYSYDRYSYQYDHQKRLKDALSSVSKIISQVLPQKSFAPTLIFENTRTLVGNDTYEADFYFDCEETLTESKGSAKGTTIRVNDENIFATTLDIFKSSDSILNYINTIVPLKEEEIPEWIAHLKYMDDEEQEQKIESCEKTIINAQQEIKSARIALNRNLHYKSILYTNGQQLVNVVFEILEQLLDCDLTNFRDEKHEDFLITKTGHTFIGEIKGVTTNVKSEHISQLEVHYHRYMDNLQENNKEELVHQVLIINSFRTKELSLREPVAQTQIDLANRNGCLVILTHTLLKLFELYVNGKITSLECDALFCNKRGVLSEEDFKEYA